MGAPDALSTELLDGAFELITDEDGAAQIVRRPRLIRAAETPHLIAGHPVCTIHPHSPEGLAEQLLEILNERGAWGEI